MGTVPAGLTDVESELLEGLDFASPCIVQVIRGISVFGLYIPLDLPSQCDQPAAWALSCKVCHKGGLLCDEDLQRLTSGPMGECMSCNTTGPILALFTIVQLPKGRS